MKKLKDGWKNIHLKDILSDDIRNGYSPLPAENETGYWVLGLGALTDNGLNKDEIKPVHFEKRVEKSLLEFGDFLVSRSNTPDKVGRSILFKNEIINCSYPDLMMRFRINETLAYPYFIEQYLKTKSIRAYFSNSASGSSKSMVKINKSILEKTPLLLPPLEEQIQIAETLSTWDNAIQTTEKLLENSRQQKKALMQRLLKGNDWLQADLAELAVISKGSQLNKNTLLDNGQYAVINGGIEPSGYTDKFNTESHTITISEGGNSCGYIGFQKEKFWCGGHCYALSNLKINCLFLYQLLKYNEENIMRLRVGSGLPNIQKKALESFSLSYPQDINEQQKIAEILSTADQEIETLQRKLECLKLEKGALMQRLLRDGYE
ncbi:restriction endonuclease subunit S [Actinobacillus indolicus]|uniref:Restriction endonuclease subunit S n=1 Tax=Actinobacillus indolicus TaxID=51049 RepID=A0A4P7CMA2_9PAST|nr:restriction endonuclease subunit S [Actinobacillus indolicus]QBQ64537.1 restriction endonuclease subunit S [Actinobacillus indolicus]